MSSSLNIEDQIYYSTRKNVQSEQHCLS